MNKIIKFKHTSSHHLTLNSAIPGLTLTTTNSSSNNSKLTSVNQFSTSNSCKLSENSVEISRNLIESALELRNQKLRELTVKNNLKKLRLRAVNLSRPPLIYEGPVYLNYWLRRRRSGARK